MFDIFQGFLPGSRGAEVRGPERRDPDALHFAGKPRGYKCSEGNADDEHQEPVYVRNKFPVVGLFQDPASFKYPLYCRWLTAGVLIIGTIVFIVR